MVARIVAVKLAPVGTSGSVLNIYSDFVMSNNCTHVSFCLTGQSFESIFATDLEIVL